MDEYAAEAQRRDYPSSLGRGSGIIWLSAIISGLCTMLSASVMVRMTLHGTPAAKEFDGMFLVTTLPAPITQLSPIVTPGHTVTEAPNQQLLPILTGFA